jgi:hypothetical protein
MKANVFKSGRISLGAYGAAKRGQTVTLTMPLLIRLMEYAREDAKSDLDLHHVAERLSRHSGLVDMDDYQRLVAR